MQIASSFLDWSWWSLALAEYVFHPLITVILCLLSVFVVLGNLLVVSAIWHENQLHSVTNYLIASLAAADCLVGALVMPFSIISEIVVGSWTFGATWCDLWHSFDVLASTASIMNLCAISWDRYLAITDPISYPTKMTPKIVALYIVSLWISSSLISFPAILWWRAVAPGPLQPFTPTSDEKTISSMNSSSQSLLQPSSPSSFTSVSFPRRSLPVQDSPQLFKCVFTDDPYYLLFSSTVSFYGPLCVMLYAYYCIYKAAVQQTRFLKYGSKQVMIGRRGKKSKRFRNYSENCSLPGNDRDKFNDLYLEGGSSEASQHLVLRAHRGGFQPCKPINEHSSKQSKDDDVRKDDNLGTSQNQILDLESGVSKSSLASDDLGQFDLKGQRSLTRSSPQISSRRNLVNIRNSRQDRIRVDSQRFDVKPSSSENSSTFKRSSTLLRDTHIVTNKTGTAQAEAARTSDIMERKTETSVLELDRPSEQKKSGINDRFISVDVHLSSDQQSQATKKPISSCDTGHIQDHHHQMTVDRYNSFCSSSGGYEMHHASRVSSDSSRSPFHMVEDELATTSSGSYGTGSIASVRARNFQEKDDNSNDKSRGNNNCDIDVTFRMKAASPTRNSESTRYRESKSMMEMNEATKVPASSCKKQRASFEDQNFRNDVISSLKMTKALNLIAWTKSRKSGTRAEGSGIDSIEPPRSLLPLMMNSDTSTDSSISCFHGSNNNKSSNENDTVQTRQASLTTASQNRVEIASAPSRKHTDENSPSLCRTDEETSIFISSQDRRDENNPKDVNLDKIECSDAKAQVLYYESNKLVQSIIDLSTIRYIDCTSDGQTDNDFSTPAYAKSQNQTSNNEVKLNVKQTEQVHDLDRTNNRSGNLPRQQSNRKVGKKLTKLAKERKAAKTLGIVVGVFVLCWLPFFVMNIIVALCGANCIYKFQTLSQIVTWLGWLNSAMNPVIYACWSRDFRRAFRRVLCAWVEFICPYEGANIARKMKLKKRNQSNYPPHDALSSRTTSSSVKKKSVLAPPARNDADVASAQGGGLSIERSGVNFNLTNGGVSRISPRD